MTLVEAVQSLGIFELTAVSWINVIPTGSGHVAVCTVALLLPFNDIRLSEEFRAGERRFWRDQKRRLESGIPIQDQISELQHTRLLGNLAFLYLMPIHGQTSPMWAIKTHAGSEAERLEWITSIIAMEGRSPRRLAPPERSGAAANGE